MAKSKKETKEKPVKDVVNEENVIKDVEVKAEAPVKAEKPAAPTKEVVEEVVSEEADPKNRIEISSKRSRLAQHELAWFIEMEEAILKGFRFARSGSNGDRCTRSFRGLRGRVVLYKEGTESIKATEKVQRNVPQKQESGVVNGNPIIDVIPAHLRNLEELEAKADLLAYAKGKGMEVPTDKKQPAAIKKYLAETEVELKEAQEKLNNK
jgi:hypothetical protein